MTVRHLSLPSFDKESLAVDIWGDELSAQPLIISHGMGGDSNALVWLVEELFRQKKSSLPLTVVTYDLRGHGNSTRVFPPATSIEEVLAKDLQTICQYLSITKPIFLGHSFGGIVVQEYFNRQLQPSPQQIFLVSSALTFPGLSTIRTKAYRWLTRYSTHQKKISKRTPSDHLRYKNSFDFHPGRVWSDLKAMGGWEFLLVYLSLLGWQNPQPDTLAQTTCEYIWGNRDWVLWPSRQQQTLKAFSFFHSQEIDSNHNPVVNTPQDLAKIILESSLFEKSD